MRIPQEFGVDGSVEEEILTRLEGMGQKPEEPGIEACRHILEKLFGHVGPEQFIAGEGRACGSYGKPNSSRQKAGTAVEWRQSHGGCLGIENEPMAVQSQLSERMADDRAPVKPWCHRPPEDS